MTLRRASWSLFLAALLWRWALPVPLPEKGGPRWALALFGLVTLAAVYRLYRAGDVPAGFASMDECGALIQAKVFIADGLPSYIYYGNLETGADGAIPYYLMTTCMRGFGGSLLAWRMDAILLGIVTAAVMYKLGKDLAGR